MPRQGEIDESAIRRYHQIFDCIERWGASTASIAGLGRQQQPGINGGNCRNVCQTCQC